MTRSGEEKQEDTLPRMLVGWTTAAIDEEAASSSLLPLLPVQRPHQVIGTSPPDTVSPKPAHVTTGEKVREMSEIIVPLLL